MQNKRWTIAILTYAAESFLERSVASAAHCRNADVVVINNGNHQLRERLSTYIDESSILTNAGNLGFSRGYNAHIERLCRNELLLILNDDAFITEKSLALLEKNFTDATVGVVGPVVVDETGRVTEAGFDIDMLGFPIPVVRQAAPYETGFVSACVLAIRSQLFAALGGFPDWSDFFAEDVDLCWRVWRSGKRVIVEPLAQVVHLGGASLGAQNETFSGKNLPRVFMREKNSMLAIARNERYTIAILRMFTAAAVSIMEGVLYALVFRLDLWWAQTRGIFRGMALSRDARFAGAQPSSVPRFRRVAYGRGRAALRSLRHRLFER